MKQELRCWLSCSFAAPAVACLLAAPVASQADIVYVSYGDRTGYSRPNTIEKFDLATGTDLGVFANTGLSLPEGLALDSAGNLYVANYGNNTIARFTPSGVGSVFASTGLNGPTALAFDKAGNLYAANYWGNNIEKFSPGGVGSVFASAGVSYPLGLAFDSAGNLYVANAGNVNVLKLTPSGVGSVFVSGLGRPMLGGIAFDSADNLYVQCQGSNPQIMTYTPSGVGSVFANDYRLDSTQLAFDSAGNLYSANYGSDTIEKITPAGAVSLFGQPTASPYGIAIQVIPEPATLALISVGAATPMICRRRK